MDRNELESLVGESMEDMGLIENVEERECSECGCLSNTGSPKLPTLVECERWYVKEKCGFEHITELEKNVIREIHDYICRQLRAGA